MNYRGKTAAAFAAAIITVLGASGALAADTSIEINALTGNTTEIVAYTEEEAPIEIDNTLYAAARITAYAMGMTAEWNQETHTATLRIRANKDSSMPVECFAYEMSSVVDKQRSGLEPKDISMDIRPGSEYALIKLNYIDNDGQVYSLGKTVKLDGLVRMTNENTLMFPIRSVAESMGLEIGWDQESRTVSVNIPAVPEIMSGLGVVSADTALDVPQTAVAAAAMAEPESEIIQPQEPSDNGRIYLGTFKITHYAAGIESNGVWGNATAWAGDITPGRTIAVDSGVIAPLSWVYIDGYGLRCAEDCGSAVKGNTIDVAVCTYAEAIQLGVVYRDVYLCTD